MEPQTTHRADPAPPARHDHERLQRRARAWLWFGFAVCPCHLPFTLLAVGTLFGGTAVGAAVTGNPVTVGVALGTVTAFAYVRGWRLMRASQGCGPRGCRSATAASAADVRGADPARR